MPLPAPKMLILAITSGVVLNCANAVLQPEEKPATTAAGTGVVAPAIKVTTSANGVLGYLLYADDDEIMLLTTSGWIVRLDHSGSIIVGDSIYFSGTECTGTAYRYSDNSIYGKSLFYSGTAYYKPASSPSNSLPLTSVSYVSRLESNGNCTNFSGTASEATELTTATLAETGLPATITGPIVLQTP